MVSVLKIKGRMISQERFFDKFESMCHALGFGGVKPLKTNAPCTAEECSESALVNYGKDAVIMLSCKVLYNPRWGGLCGHPQLIADTNNDKTEDERCPAKFLAPFLRQYHSAQKQIYLIRTMQGECLISLPAAFLANTEKTRTNNLLITLDKVAEPDANGAFIPVSTCGTRIVYNLSSRLRAAFDNEKTEWSYGRKMSIGKHLKADMFVFQRPVGKTAESDPFQASLLPHLEQLVTHDTPHLRAAEIHLEQEFTRTITQFTKEKQATSQNLLCLAGLVIDMTPFVGHGEKYFIPWKAYLEKMDGNSPVKFALNQDDLYLRLTH